MISREQVKEMVERVRADAAREMGRFLFQPNTPVTPEAFAASWATYLHLRYGPRVEVPRRVTVDLGSIPFAIPPCMATTAEGWRAIEAHNRRVGVFA